LTSPLISTLWKLTQSVNNTLSSPAWKFRPLAHGSAAVFLGSNTVHPNGDDAAHTGNSDHHRSPHVDHGRPNRGDSAGCRDHQAKCHSRRRHRHRPRQRNISDLTKSWPIRPEVCFTHSSGNHVSTVGGSPARSWPTSPLEPCGSQEWPRCPPEVSCESRPACSSRPIQFGGLVERLQKKGFILVVGGMLGSGNAWTVVLIFPSWTRTRGEFRAWRSGEYRVWKTIRWSITT